MARDAEEFHGRQVTIGKMVFVLPADVPVTDPEVVEREELIARIESKDAEIARLKAQLEAAQAKADVIGGEWCRQNRAEGRGACGACSLCVADANDLVQRLADTILAMYESETTASAAVPRKERSDVR